MVKLKLKIKLVLTIKLFNFFLVFNFLFTQSALLSHNYNYVYAINGSYYRSENLNNRNYDITISNTWKNFIESSFTYYSNDIFNDNSKSIYELSVGFYFKENKKIKYSIYLNNYYLNNNYNENYISKNFISSISLKFFNLVKVNKNSAMNYYPYIEYEKYLNNNIDEYINNTLDMFAYDDFLYFGFTIAFDKYWFKPFYKITVKGQNIIYSGLEFGIWNMIK